MNDYNPRPTKRTKYRACDSCVTSKTRCDDVTPDGCLVCRKRNRPCSLSEMYMLGGGEMSLRPSPSVAPVDETTVELKKRVEVVEARSWDMEQRLQAVETSGSSRGQTTPQGVLVGPLSGGMMGSVGPSPITQMEPVMDVETETSRLVGRTYMARFDERLFSPVDVRGFPDAVQRGLVSKDQVDMAFQLFKHRFSRILPLAPFLVSSTPTPSHPFVVLAILTHIPSIGGSWTAPLVEESVRHVMSGAIGQDVMLALLILALQPSQPDQMSGPSPVRLLSMAYGIGKSLGLERIAGAALKRKERLCEPWWGEMLERILLFEAVKAQHNLVHLAHARIDDFLPSCALHLPDHPLDNFNESIKHLRAMTELVDIFKPYLFALAEAEAEVLFSDQWNLATLLDKWSPVAHNLEMFTARQPPLETERHIILFALGVRTTFYVQTLPTPSRAEHKALGYTWVFENMLKYTFAMVAFFLRTETEMARRTLLTAVMAISSARRVVQFYRLANSDAPSHLSFDIVTPAEEKMYAMGGAPARTLAKIYQAFKDEPKRYDPHQTQSFQEGNGIIPTPGFDPNDWMGMFNLDLSSWETLMGTFGPVDDGGFGSGGGAFGNQQGF